MTMLSEQAEQIEEAEKTERWNKLYHYDELAEGLFDLLADAEMDGLTIDEIADGLSIPLHVARMTIRYMRKAFAHDHDVNLIWRTAGRDRRYLLTKDLGIAQDRLDTRLRVFASSFETELHILGSLLHGLDRASADGQDAAYLVKTLGRLHEDVREMLDRRANQPLR